RFPDVVRKHKYVAGGAAISTSLVVLAGVAVARRMRKGQTAEEAIASLTEEELLHPAHDEDETAFATPSADGAEPEAAAEAVEAAEPEPAAALARSVHHNGHAGPAEERESSEAQ